MIKQHYSSHLATNYLKFPSAFVDNYKNWCIYIKTQLETWKN